MPVTKEMIEDYARIRVEAALYAIGDEEPSERRRIEFSEAIDKAEAAIDASLAGAEQPEPVIDWFETCLNVVHEHKKQYVVSRDDLRQRGKANAALYANLIEVCESISQAIHDLKAMPTSAPPADEWLTGGRLTPEEAWTILCETPDITSPEEYPDHALITLDQLRGFMERTALKGSEV